MSTKPKHPAPPDVRPLSKGDKQLLEGLAAGQTNIQLGRQLHRSEKTVRNRLTHLYAKLGASNRAEAVAIYLRKLSGDAPAVDQDPE